MLSDLRQFDLISIICLDPFRVDRIEHPNRPFPDLRGISFYFAHAPILSSFGASGNPGAIQAVANLKLPKVEVDKVEWDLNVRRGPGGLIKKVEARQV